MSTSAVSSSSSKGGLSSSPPKEQFLLRNRFLFPIHKVVCGRGSLGEVLQALDITTGRLVAAKVLPVDGIKVDQVVQEVNVIKGLSHRNIVQYIGTAREGPNLYIVLEHMPGGSLASLLRLYGPLPELLCRKYIADVLEGLRYLHSKKVAHRDLKCENLLLCSSGVVKLADFGCSREYVEGEQANTILGTPLFMAPEVAMAAGPYDPFLADIWTVGVTLLQMITGRHPFSDECNSPMKYFLMISRAGITPTLPANISVSCADFLQRCLVREPLDRASLEELLYHEFIEGTVGEESEGGQSPLRRIPTIGNA